MSTLAELRADLQTRLTAAGLDTVAHVPEELPTGVVAVIDADEDFLTPGETYVAEVEVWVSFKVYILAELTSNEQATADLDGALSTALGALVGTPWQVGSVGKPGPFHTSTWLAHGVAIPVRNIITLT